MKRGKNPEPGSQLTAASQQKVKDELWATGGLRGVKALATKLDNESPVSRTHTGENSSLKSCKHAHSGMPSPSPVSKCNYKKLFQLCEGFP